MTKLIYKKAAKAAGEKSIEMLHLKDLTKVTGYIRGGCTSIGMKNKYPTFIHEAAKEKDKIHGQRRQAWASDYAVTG